MIKLEPTVEGSTKLYVPTRSLLEREPPTLPVFFNPAAKTNRDISVAVVKVTNGSTYCDATSGLGARGIRIAKETSDAVTVVMNDFNSDAIRLARRNARANSVFARCEFSSEDANVFLFSRAHATPRIDYVDVDPFGSPSQYTQAAFAASWNDTILSFTATDTPVLCGVHPRVSLRRYGSVSLRNDFNHELGIRILLHYCARVAAAQDIGIEPVLAHSTRHYLRVYVRARRGAVHADGAMKHSGYVVSCTKCGENSVDEALIRRCPSCGAAVACAGPLWTGPLTDQGVVAAAARVCSMLRFPEGERILLSLRQVDECPPTGYDLETVCSRLRIASVPQKRVIEALRDGGHKCIRHPFERSGIKTDATYKEVSEAVRSTKNEW